MNLFCGCHGPTCSVAADAAASGDVSRLQIQQGEEIRGVLLRHWTLVDALSHSRCVCVLSTTGRTDTHARRSAGPCASNISHLLLISTCRRPLSGLVLLVLLVLLLCYVPLGLVVFLAVFVPLLDLYSYIEMQVYSPSPWRVARSRAALPAQPACQDGAPSGPVFAAVPQHGASCPRPKCERITQPPRVTTCVRRCT